MKKEMVFFDFTKTLNRQFTLDPILTRVLGVITFSMLTGLGAFIYIPLPFTPVPITMQTFFVLLSGLVLNKKDAAISQISYVVLGGLGLPIFVGARAGLISVTTGYLIGFIIAAWMIGFLSRKKDSFIWLVFSLALASFTILISGSLWLSIFMKVSILSSFKMGMLPFILGDSLKIILAVSTYRLYQAVRDFKN